MGGDIKVTSQVGKGSIFRVKILLSEVTNPTRIAPVEAPIFGYHGPRKTILITDDDPTHRDLLREVLAPLGFILLSAPDGPGCLALAQHCRPDCFCWISRWRAWTAGRWRKRCARAAITRPAS
jgi:hypothetical protein